MPEVQKRYRVAPDKIFAGHSLGGLLAIYALITRPNIFNAYVAVSPSLQWDGGRVLHQAQQFFATDAKLNSTLFISLAGEGNSDNPMSRNFSALEKPLSQHAPEDFLWKAEHYPDETHGSTVLRAHYAGLCMIFKGWDPPRDETSGFIGGLARIENHYRNSLSVSITAFRCRRLSLTNSAINSRTTANSTRQSRSFSGMLSFIPNRLMCTKAWARD